MFRFKHQAKLDLHRQRIKEAKTWSSSLRKFLHTPLPNPNQPISELQFVALDFETSGLNGQNDKILSIGTIELASSIIELGSVQETIVNHAQFVQAKSVVVNELTPLHLATGVHIDSAMDTLFELICGKVVIAHGAHIEKQFIDRYLQSRYQLSALPCFYIDTIDLEKRFSFKGRKKLHTSYNLTQLRNEYGLPQYSEHSAGIDALSCAELFLLQTKKLKLAQHSTSQKILARF